MKQAAILAGFKSHERWYRIESGRSPNLTLDVLTRIAAAVGLQPRDLLRRLTGEELDELHAQMEADRRRAGLEQADMSPEQFVRVMIELDGAEETVTRLVKDADVARRLLEGYDGDKERLTKLILKAALAGLRPPRAPRG